MIATLESSAFDALMVPADDRRAHPRVSSSELPPTRILIPDRGPAVLVDLSVGGALIDLPFHVRAQSRFAVQLQTAVDRVELLFEPLRCYLSALENGVATYRAAGRFDGRLDLDALMRRASDPVERLVVALNRLREPAGDATTPSHVDTVFDASIATAIRSLRRGESPAVVMVQVKALLERRYSTIQIQGAAPHTPRDLVAVTAFGWTIRSSRRLSTRERRSLKAHAQLLAVLDEARRVDPTNASPWQASPMQVIRTPAQWLSPEQGMW